MAARDLLRRFASDPSGSAGVEMVLILPLAVLLTFGALEWGYFLYSEHQVIKSVRNAARFAARQPLSAFGCTAAKAEGPIASDGSALGSIRSRTANVARLGQTASTGAAPVVTGWTDAQIEVRYACIAAGGIYSSGYAPQVAVVGTPKYPSLFGSLAGFSSSRTLFARQQALVTGI